MNEKVKDSIQESGIAIYRAWDEYDPDLDINNYPNYDPSKSILVHSRDRKKFREELERKGWKRLYRELETEGLGDKSIGCIYSPLI